MFITGTGGTSIKLAIDTKTYPDFQPIHISEERSGGTNYFASEDGILDSGDVLLGSKPIVDISFAVAGVERKYAYYDGSGYAGLKLLNETIPTLVLWSKLPILILLVPFPELSCCLVPDLLDCPI